MKSTNASFPSNTYCSMLSQTLALHILLIFYENCGCGGHFHCATHFLEDGPEKVTWFSPMSLWLSVFLPCDSSPPMDWWTCWVQATGSRIWSPWMLLTVCFLSEINPAPFPGASKLLSSRPAIERSSDQGWEVLGCPTGLRSRLI